MERLPDEIEHDATGRAVAWAAAIALLLVVAVNQLAIRRSPAEVRTFDGRTVAEKWRLASEGTPEGGVVVVGDSSGNFAVDTAILEAQLGVPARNLCTYGRFLVEGAGWMLDQALESGDGVPSLVVVVLGSQTFVLPRSGFAFAQVPISIGEWSSRLPRTGLPFAEAAAFTVARAFPLYAQHKSFERGVRQGRWRIDPSRLPIGPDGTSVLPRAYPDGVAPFADKVLQEFRDFEGDVPTARDRAALDGLVAAADERGFELVFIDSPMWAGLGSHPEHQAFLARVHAAIDEAVARSPRAHRLGGALQTFEAAEMENPFHLTAPAASRFTTELVSRLGSAGLVPGR